MAAGLGFSWDDAQEDPFQAVNRTPQPGAPPAPPPSATPTAPVDPFALQGGSNPAANTPQTDWNTPSYARGTVAPPTSVGAAAAPAASAPPAAGAAPSASAPNTAAYQDALAKIQQTTDPQQQAVLKDQLARTVFSTLKTAGHDVKWNGDQLMIDGRPYVVGGDSGTSGAYEQGGVTGGAAAETARTASAPPPGFTQDKWNDANKHDPKYDVGHAIQDHAADLHAIPDEAGRKAYMENLLHSLVPNLEAQGWKVYAIRGEKIQLGGGPNNEPVGWVDTVVDIEGAAIPAWQPENAGGPQPVQGPGLLDTGAQGAAGVDIGTSYMPPGYAPPAAPASFEASAPGYQPGDIGTGDIPTFSFDDMVAQLGNAGPTDKATEDLVSSILTHPESVDEHTLETLKARSKDELAQMSAGELEALQARGHQLGIEDSHWLESEMNSSRRSRDQSLVKSNRDLEVSAATTNMADKRAAAELGSSYTNAKASRNLAATQLAADTTLRAAALRGDRMALRESINQKATELGQSADRIQLDYTMGLIDDATRRGIAELGASIDRAKLAQAGREFQEDLAFKIMALQQADAQFGASYGLDRSRLEFDANNEAYDRYKETFGTSA